MLRPLAGHLGCLRALNIWLLDLAADARASRVLEQVLQARAALCCHCRCGRAASHADARACSAAQLACVLTC
jgi:hypothetical protein